MSIAIHTFSGREKKNETWKRVKKQKFDRKTIWEDNVVPQILSMVKDLPYVTLLTDLFAYLGYSALTKLLDKVPRLVEARDEDGFTPIFVAAAKDSLKAAELLIKKVSKWELTLEKYRT